MYVRRHARVAHGAQQNRVEVAVKHFHRAARQGCAIAQIPIRAPIELGHFDFSAACGRS